jgi:hypothetical protein
MFYQFLSLSDRRGMGNITMHAVGAKTRRRRGSVYIIVISTSLVVTMLGLGGMYAATARAARSQASRDEMLARRLAISAVELLVQEAQNTAAWREAAADGPLFEDLPLGEGYISASVTDAVDGNLANNLVDPVVITGVGRLGSARQVYRVTATPPSEWPSWFAGVMHSHGTLSVGAAIVRSSSPIGSNSIVTATGGTIKADIYAVGSISGTTYHGTKTTMVPARPMPQPSVFSYYSSFATPIPYASIPSGKLRRTVLSGATNPFGSGLNDRGIYSIDCEGKKLVIEECRVAATLIITNCSDLTIQSSVHTDSWETGLPSLMVSGDLHIATDTADLRESSFGNFNPGGTPYEGVSDTDSTDVYPSVLNGLLYVSGNVTMAGRITVVGSLVAGGTINIRSGSVVALSRRLTGSPPQFFPVQFLVDSTSWVREVD